MNGPEFLTPREEAKLAEIIEVDIDAWVESQKIHEVEEKELDEHS